MSNKSIRVVYLLGVIAVLLGTLDPIEGSVLIAGGSLLLAFAAHKRNDRYRRFFLAGSIMIIIGVAALFYVSSLGGFDPRSEWWWFIPIAPYPLGWLMVIILLIRKAISHAKPA